MDQFSKRPEVVALCGSTKFKKEFIDTATSMTLNGIIVIGPHVFQHADGLPLSEEEKEALDELHLRKIDRADRIHVLNVGGYIGSSTKKEIDYAYLTGKAITYREPILTVTIEVSYAVKSNEGLHESYVKQVAEDLLVEHGGHDMFDFIANPRTERRFG